jgi:hypothetical protein
MRELLLDKATTLGFVFRCHSVRLRLNLASHVCAASRSLYMNTRMLDRMGGRKFTQAVTLTVD